MGFCGCHGGAGLELTAWQAPGDAGQRQVRGLNIMEKKYCLSLLPDKLGVCRFDSGSPPPDWLRESTGFYAITVTSDETSVVCREDLIPAGSLSEKHFRALKVQGPLDFSLTGVLASLINPLAGAGIAVFTISTYDTDYILLKEKDLEKAIIALSDFAIITR